MLLATLHLIYAVGLPASNVIGIVLLALGTFFFIVASDRIENLLYPAEQQGSTEMPQPSAEISDEKSNLNGKLGKALAAGAVFCFGWWLLTDDLLDSVRVSTFISVMAFWALSASNDDEH